jgi:hypothetical protein
MTSQIEQYIDIILWKFLMICIIKTFKNVLSIKFGREML